MIALNELLNNIELYKSTYKMMGLKSNLSRFVELENKLKNIQLEAEHKRSDCNKKCANLVKLKKDNIDISDHLIEIVELDNEINKLQKQLSSIIETIENNLKKLHNLPDLKNTQNLQIETSKTKSDLNALKSYLSKICTIKSCLKSSKNFIKEQCDVLFEQNELPLATYCKHGIVILCEQNKIDDLAQKLIEYFKQNSISMIERSVCKLKKSSSREIFIHLNNRLYLKLEIKREFFTREFKLKYRDKSIDTTKFVNQINIVF